mmetsp:Transcript_101092/g.294350  ORF Transcript_101092/g.294350 Transcript_101092/m.294350 type:complete len:493 (-) Transcript_101092:28-1506(-)
MSTGLYTFDKFEYVKRFNGTGGIKWVLDHSSMLKPGLVLPLRDELPPEHRYSELVRTNFCNHTPRTEIMHLGTCHVAVGFNDLSMLLTCDLRDPPSEDSRAGPLRFVGIDSSPFCVAKSTVLLEMLRLPNVPTEHCLQAWFSSTFSRTAAKSFCDAARRVAGHYIHDQVRSFLHHWASAVPEPLAKARRLWLATRTDRCGGAIPSLKRHVDRMAMCRYVLTGDLLGGEEPEVGSLPMWSVPEGTPPNMDGEMAFHAVDIDDLGVGKDERDVAQRLSSTLLSRIERLRGWLREGALHVELHCKQVSLDAEVVRWIAGMRPWTMSWSNVLDYMSPQVFHRLARSCSANGDTLHYSYSMNWTTETYGTCIMDTDDLEMRKAIIKGAHDMLDATSRLTPAGQLLLLPPYDTPLNYTGYFLAMALHKQWVQHFFSAERAGPDVQLGVVQMHTYNPLAHNSVRLSMVWTYDTSIKLQDQATGAQVSADMGMPTGCSMS